MAASQMSLPLPNNGLPKSRTTGPRAAYHLHRDVPAHLAGNPGDIRPVLPTPTENGVFMRQHEIGVPRDSIVGNHAAERTNYPNVPGQQVMGPPHNPEQFGELDDHGNLFHYGSQKDHDYLYVKHGPFMGSTHEAWWQKHSTPQDVSTSAVVHTMQSPGETGTHSYIAGPMREGGTPTSILIHRGIPWVADGHHRMQEARGRGEATFPARVINLDQLQQSLPVGPKVSKKTPAHEVLQHMINQHGVNAQVAQRAYPDPIKGHAKIAREEPDTHFHGKRDFGPSYGGLGAPAPQQDFTDHMNPAQADWDGAPSRPAARRNARGRQPVR